MVTTYSSSRKLKEVKNRILAKVRLTLGTLGPQPHPVVFYIYFQICIHIYKFVFGRNIGYIPGIY